MRRLARRLLEPANRAPAGASVCTFSPSRAQKDLSAAAACLAGGAKTVRSVRRVCAPRSPVRGLSCYGVSVFIKRYHSSHFILFTIGKT